ncbi:MAG: hypothetical protein SP1CHLAM9_08640 [Chlamydiia bacterium]|nr:hypothetical protein [Chlamydiia bacterium]MCH9624246.1 hypothetical protein [Chlamydiia bacterium]
MYMKVEIAPKEFSVREMVFQVKYYVLGFLSLLLLISYVMAKIHPALPSYAKEYNYLYSMGAALEKGREINLEKFDEKLVTFSALRPEFDGFFAKYYMQNQEFEKVEPLMESVKSRLPIKNEVTENFSKASVELEKKNYQGAYSYALKLKDHSVCKESFPLVFAYNLYRILVLEEILGYEELSLATKERLVHFIKEDKCNKFSENVIMKKMLKLLE